MSGDWFSLSPEEALAQDRYVYEHRDDPYPEPYTPDELAELEAQEHQDGLADRGFYDHDPCFIDEALKWGAAQLRTGL